jgi:heme oxygenase
MLTSALSTVLKERTKFIHAQIEHKSILSKLTSPKLNLAEYQITLLQTLKLHSQWQSEFVKAVDELDAPAFLSLNLHVSDLEKECLEFSSNYIEFDSDVTPSLRLVSQEKLAAAAYVLRGSHLGSALIFKALKQNCGVASASSFGYYTSLITEDKKNETLTWREWKQNLDKYAIDSCLDEKLAVEGAIDSFLTIGDWYKSYRFGKAKENIDFEL